MLYMSYSISHMICVSLIKPNHTSRNLKCISLKKSLLFMGDEHYFWSI